MAIERDEAYWLRGTITVLEATVGGLQYELHVRDIALKEKDQRIAELEQQSSAKGTFIISDRGMNL